ncbi:MAG TPA: glutamate-1-semialdehyde 2,1-aminomutase [Candidatus Acidoferrales bacterium]|nr:glutamate-1-semialdehyde 2,1-aminomutase [Candidatus Acidoferrales bacterium]
MKKLNTAKSAKLFSEAKKYLPGGVNSPVRAFKSVGRDPLFISKAKGQYVYDVDGNKFLDFVGSWGPMILGHAHPKVVAAIKNAAANGTSFGAPTLYEVEMAKLVCKMMPSVEVVRMVNSGTEATMSAVRVARAFTNRDKIIKFAGCYHGHFDSFLIKAGSGATTFGIPDSPGVPKELAAETLVAEFNDITSVVRLFNDNRNEIAAVIVEPVVGNMGVVIPENNFLNQLLEIAHTNGALFILDEVMTGFRLAPGGAQEIYGVKPDLTTFGKIIGGGLPVGAYGGREEIMRMISPDGPVYQAGTLSGNPLAMAAGIAQLKILNAQKSLYRKLEKMGKFLEDGINDNLKKLGLNYRFNRAGSMFTLFFSTEEVRNFSSALKSDTKKFAGYFNEMLKRGVYLPPSQFEAAFISAAHTDKDIEKTIAANHEALKVVG